MRILFVSEQFPYPLDTGGNVRTFNLLKGLASAHEVTLVAAARAPLSAEDLRVVGNLCESVRLVNLAPIGLGGEAWAFARTVGTATPFILARHSFAAVRREIASAFAHPRPSRPGARRAGTPPFGAVHFNHLDTTVYESAVPSGVHRVVDEHNVVTNQVQTTAAHEPRLMRRALLQREHRKLRHFEAAACNRMDRCLACSDADARSLQALGVRAPIAIIPNGVDLDYFVLAQAPATAPDVVFVGTLDYDPCERGVWFFCNEILPLLRRQRPDVRLVAVGRNPSPRLRDLAASNPGIVLTGRVEDVRPFVHAAQVCVVPLLSGSGTRLKILEAMAMGAPVVTTSIGVEGIDGVNGEHMLVADAPAEFARGVLSVMHDPQRAAALRTAGRRLVEEKYGWQAICSALLREYGSLSH